MQSSPAAAPGHLQWRCRRGLKELDVLLERYLHGPFHSADSGERQAFERLLALQDPELQALLMGTLAAEDPELRNVVARIRTAGR